VLVDLHVMIDEKEAADIAAMLQNTMLDGVCLVALDSLPDKSIVEAATALELAVFVGAQMPLSRGHILAIPKTGELDVFTLREGCENDQDLIGRLNDAGCAVIPCHPYDRDSGTAIGDRIAQLTGLHGLIAVTADSAVTANDLALEMVDSLDLPALGGSADGDVGKAATLLANPVSTQEELVDEVRRGDCWALSFGDGDRWSSVARPRSERGDRGRGRGRDNRGRDGRNRSRDRNSRSRDARGRGERSRPDRNDRQRSDRSDRTRGDRGRSRGPSEEAGKRDDTRGRRESQRGDRQGPPAAKKQPSNANGNSKSTGNSNGPVDEHGDPNGNR
jgi:hypothetical protein